MKKIALIVTAIMAMGMVSCEETIVDKEWDIASIEFEAESMTVNAEGGQIVIAVESTGIDNVTFDFKGNNWSIDEENGDLYPTEGWIKLNKVINEFEDATRALARWQQGIDITIEPNETGYERRAYIIARSFNISDKIEIIQAAK